MPRVLLVEDDVNLMRAITYILERESFTVTAAATGEAALALAAQVAPELVVLDINLPGIDGFEVCRRLRQGRGTRRTLVLMLTARRDVDDMLHGLECQADDYVAKPCDPRVLIARMHALLRRVEEPKKVGAVKFDGLRVELNAREVWVQDALVSLTRTEFDLLYFLASHANQVLTRDQILDAVRSEALSTGDRAVDVHVVGLRKKLQTQACHLKTVRGVGYKFSL